MTSDELADLAEQLAPLHAEQLAPLLLAAKNTGRRAATSKKGRPGSGRVVALMDNAGGLNPPSTTPTGGHR